MNSNMAMIIPTLASTAPPPAPLLLTRLNLQMNITDMLTNAEAQEAPASPTANSVNGSTTSADSSVACSETVTNDMLKRGWIAPFLLHLHQMLRREGQKIIRWTEDGIAFQILDKDALTNQVLPKYFKNKNFASFQRQLNYFGFRKWSKARAEFPTYSRDHFTRDNYSAMSLVKRQSKKSRKRPAPERDEEKHAKRPAVQPTWTGADRCKPILPRPEDQDVLSSPVELPVASSLGSISPLSKFVAAPTLPNPFMVHPAPHNSIPVISPTRKIPTGCKLPSLRELSVSNALLSNVASRSCWLS